MGYFILGTMTNPPPHWRAVVWCRPPLCVVLGKPAGVFLLTSASILCPPHFQSGSSYLQPFLVKNHLLLPFSFHTSLTTRCYFCSGYSLYLRAGVYIVSIFAIRYLKVANICKIDIYRLPIFANRNLWVSNICKIDIYQLPLSSLL